MILEEAGLFEEEVGRNENMLDIMGKVFPKIDWSKRKFLKVEVYGKHPEEGFYLLPSFKVRVN